MAVTKVAERWEARRFTTGEDHVQSFVRQWTVELDDPATAETAIADAVVAFDRSARMYARHPAWRWAVCRSLTGAPEKGPLAWLVTATYSTAPFRAAGTGLAGLGAPDLPDPDEPSVESTNRTPADARPPSVTVSRTQVTEPLEKDAVTGLTVTNTVGDRFDPPVEVFRSRLVFTFRIFRARADLKWKTRSAFLDSVNDAPVTILGTTYPAETLRCTDYSAESVWETGPAGMGFYFALTVQAEYDPDGWVLEILNTGRRKNQGGEAVAVVDKAGQPVSDPVLLSAGGLPVPPGGNAHYVFYRGYVRKDWSALLA